MLYLMCSVGCYGNKTNPSNDKTKTNTLETKVTELKTPQGKTVTIFSKS